MLTVHKIGGGKSLNIEAFLDDFAALTSPTILVHGGNEELTDLQTRLGHPPQMVTSSTGQASRYTDRETMEYFWMIYCGKGNKLIVEGLQKRGQNAIGLSGLDGGLAIGKRRDKLRAVEDGKPKIIHGDYTGSVDTINVSLLHLLLDHGYTPVITPPALSLEGEAINVDGDKLATQIAIQMGASELNFYMGAPGLMRDIVDPTSLIQSFALDELEEVMQHAGGRMKKKLIAAKWALEGGVAMVRLGDGRVTEPIRRLNGGEGTLIKS